MADANAGQQVGSRRARALRSAGLALALVLAIVGPLLIRAGLEGRAELRRADAAETRELAIVHLGRAARWRTPLGDHDELARVRLEQLADEAELANDPALALIAWRELRGALLGTRAWGLADREQLERANLGIVRGMIAAADEAGEPEQSERWLAELEAAPASDGAGTHVAAIGFALWCVTLIGFALRGLEGGRPALIWGGANLALLLVWLLAM
ncbi:hypothetical protein ACNOYE_24580 [Nannocystaceae bacterium ST9]